MRVRVQKANWSHFGWDQTAGRSVSLSFTPATRRPTPIGRVSFRKTDFGSDKADERGLGNLPLFAGLGWT